MKYGLYIFVFLLASALSAPAAAQSAARYDTAHGPVRAVTVAAGLVHPWAVAFLPGGDYLVTERPGQLLRIAPDGQAASISGLPSNIVARGQGGLLDLALHPDFENNRLIYFSYVARGYGGTGTEVARARLAEGRNALTHLEVIFTASPKMRSDVHFGSRLLFAPDGTLYITLGERFAMDEAQKASNHLGALIRIHDDGNIPADNPCAGHDRYRPEIFSYGHRNIQGIAQEPETGIIWLHEHGPRGGDELNIARAGANYGWPEITHGANYDGSVITTQTEAEGMESPVIQWSPSIAPSGMSFYDGDKFPHWHGNLFIGALAGTHLRRVVLDGREVTDQEVLLADMYERIRDVRTGPDGHLYLLTDSNQGRLIRLEPMN